MKGIRFLILTGAVISGLVVGLLQGYSLRAVLTGEQSS